MTGLQGKRWFYFLWDDDNEEHLGRHRIRASEAEEAFFNSYVITPSRRNHRPQRYRLDGKSNAGRALRVIFEDLGSGVARIITGWEI